MSKHLLAYFLSIVLLVACSPQPQEPTLQATNTPTLTPSPTSTNTSTPTITPTPTPLPMAGPVTENVMTRLGKGWVNDLTFSPNGKILSVATSIGVYLYQVETMEFISFLPSNAFVKTTVFIDDKTLVIGTRDGTTIIWDISSTPKVLETLHRTDTVVALGVSEDNTILVIELGGRGASGVVNVINWDRVNPESANVVSTEYVFNGEFSPAKNILALDTWMENIILVDTQKMKTTATICRKCGTFALSQNGEILAATKGWGDEAQIILLDTTSQKEIANFKNPEPSTSDLTFSPDGKLLASASSTGLNLWNVETTELINTFDGASTVTFSPDGLLLVSASQDGNLVLRDIKSGDMRVIAKGFTPICQAVFQDGYVASTIGMDLSGVFDQAGGGAISRSYFFANQNTIVLRDISTGEIVRTFSLTEERSQVNSFVFSPDGKIMALTRMINWGYADEVIILWDINTGEQLKTLKGTNPIAFSPNGSMLASGLKGGQLVIWDIASGEILPLDLGLVPEQFGFGRPYKNSLVFSPDGSMIVTLSDKIILRDVSTGKQLSTLESSPSSGFIMMGFEPVGIFSPNGTLLASTSFSPTNISGELKGIIILSDVTSGQRTAVLEGHTKTITALAFSPDGTLLASGAEDNTIIVWDVKNGSQIKVLQGHTGAINSLAFSIDGNLLYSNASDGTVIIWSLDQLLP